MSIKGKILVIYTFFFEISSMLPYVLLSTSFKSGYKHKRGEGQLSSTSIKTLSAAEFLPKTTTSEHLHCLFSYRANTFICKYITLCRLESYFETQLF